MYSRTTKKNIKRKLSKRYLSKKKQRGGSAELGDAAELGNAEQGDAGNEGGLNFEKANNEESLDIPLNDFSSRINNILYHKKHLEISKLFNNNEDFNQFMTGLNKENREKIALGDINNIEKIIKEIRGDVNKQNNDNDDVEVVDEVLNPDLKKEKQTAKKKAKQEKKKETKTENINKSIIQNIQQIQRLICNNGEFNKDIRSNAEVNNFREKKKTFLNVFREFPELIEKYFKDNGKGIKLKYAGVRINPSAFYSSSTRKGLRDIKRIENIPGIIDALKGIKNLDGQPYSDTKIDIHNCQSTNVLNGGEAILEYYINFIIAILEESNFDWENKKQKEKKRSLSLGNKKNKTNQQSQNENFSFHFPTGDLGDTIRKETTPPPEIYEIPEEIRFNDFLMKINFPQDAQENSELKDQIQKILNGENKTGRAEQIHTKLQSNKISNIPTVDKINQYIDEYDQELTHSGGGSRTKKKQKRHNKTRKKNNKRKKTKRKKRKH